MLLALTRRSFAAPLSLGACAAAVSLAPPLAVPLLAAPLGWWILRVPARWLNLFLAAALLLPPLPFAWGDSGPHPGLLFAALGVLAGAIRIGQFRVRPGLLPAAFILFVSTLWLSIPSAALYSGPGLALASAARVLLFSISVYVFFWTAYGPPDQAFLPLRRLLALAVGSALLASIDFFYQLPAPAGYGAQFVWLDSGVFRRAQGVFYEASTLGNVCAFFLVMIAVAFLQGPKTVGLSRFVLGLGATVLAAALIFSYSRASLGNLAIALLVLGWMNRRRLRLARAAWGMMIALASSAAAAYLLFPAFSQIYWQRLLGSFVYFFEYTEGILSGRLQTWSALLDFLARNPAHALLGIGYKTLPYTDYLPRPLIADNMYLSLLVETGVIGLAALLLLNWAILRTAWRARASFCGTWIFCFWCGQIFQMFSGDLLTYWRVLPVYFWVLARAVREADAS